jgi:hypothetical protein
MIWAVLYCCVDWDTMFVDVDFGYCIERSLSRRVEEDVGEEKEATIYHITASRVVLLAHFSAMFVAQ